MNDQLLKPSYKSATFYGRALVTAVGMLTASGLIKPQTAEVLKNSADTAIAIAPQVVQIIQVIVDGIIQLVGLITGAYVMLKHGKEQTEIKTSYIEAAKILKSSKGLTGVEFMLVITIIGFLTMCIVAVE